MKRTLLLVVLGILVLIQFFPSTPNKATAASPNDITTKYSVPDHVQVILKRSCYDCHSNTTSYPWYASVQPVGWWLNHHIEEGKRELNFSEFGTYPVKKAAHKLDEVVETVTKSEMPLGSYLWIHGEAKLSQPDAKVLTDWAEGLGKNLSRKL